MDKQVFIDKIALLSDELQVLSSHWIRNDYNISTLEVETYLSNLRYLSEQAQILRLLLNEENTPLESPHVHISSHPATPKQEDKVNPPAPVYNEESMANEFEAELSLHEKLSEQMNESSIADSLKNAYFHKDLSLSLNDRFYYINELFNADQKDFEKVLSHLATLDSWEEVEFYLNATCVLPYAWEEKETPRTKFYEFLQARFN
jgi:hypothetical protein